MLRQEIAEIQKRNLEYLQKPRPNVVETHDNERRVMRSKEIMNELESMTDWKKP